MPSIRRLLLTTLVPVFLTGMLPAATAGTPAAAVAVSWGQYGTNGGIQGVSPVAPYAALTPALPIGGDVLLRYAFGRLYVVDRTDQSILRLNPETWSIERTYTGLGPRLQDVLVVTPRRAFVSREGAPHLLGLNLLSGEIEYASDLSVFADSDGNPEMGLMLRYQDRLFIQLRRFQGTVDTSFPPFFLAIADARTGQLIDADPQLPGLQAVRLQTESPKSRMSVGAGAAALFVSATGGFNAYGAIERVSLLPPYDTDVAVRDGQDIPGTDINALVMTSATRGYASHSTDFIVSTHLFRFESPGPVEPDELFAAVDYIAPSLVYLPGPDLLVVPQAGNSPPGLQVFNAATGIRITPSPIPTPAPPTDVQLYYSGCAPAGDVNGDGSANGSDIQRLVDCALSSGANCECADLDGDGWTTATDSLMLASALLND